jgi:hypothetical protein
MPTITFRVTAELASAIDDARGELGRSDWLRSLVETRLAQGGEVVTRLAHNQEIVGANPTPATKLESGAAVAQTPVKRTVAGSIPASPAKPAPASNVQRYREKIAPVIDKTWRTPTQIAAVTGLHERIVEKMLQGMDVEWDRGAVRLR